MNFLAHIYLSDNSEEIAIGNFIADSIRGNNFNHLPQGVIKGIKLHRSIDEFTDQNLVVRSSIHRLQPKFNKYAGIVSDIYYDYFLAKNWNVYSQTSLNQFASNFYLLLDKYFEILPNEIKDFMPQMIEQNWLVNYANLIGIRKTFVGLTHRISHKIDFEPAVEELVLNEEMYEMEFTKYFPELINHVQHYRFLMS